MPSADPFQDLQSLRIERKEPRTSEGSGRRVPWGKLVVLGVLVGGGVLAYPRLKQEAVQLRMEPPPTAMVVKTGGPATVLVGSGYVNAETDAIVGTTVGGRITRLAVKKGDRVRRGQLIAQLDDKELRAQLALARAQLAEAERNLKRSEMLMQMNAGTAQDHDRFLSARDIARAQIGVLDVKIDQMRVLAPMDGTVLETLADPGEIVMPSVGTGSTTSTGQGGIARVADLSRTVVEVDVNESDLGRLALGQKADVSLDAYPNRPFSARVLELARTADKAKATVQVKVLLDRPDAGVLPGMSAKVQFRPQKSEAEQPVRLVMPKQALLPGSPVGPGGSVFVVREGKAEQRAVETRPVDGAADQLEVVSGVSEGEIVITGALEKITPGMSLPTKKG